MVNILNIHERDMKELINEMRKLDDTTNVNSNENIETSLQEDMEASEDVSELISDILDASNKWSVDALVRLPAESVKRIHAKVVGVEESIPLMDDFDDDEDDYESLDRFSETVSNIEEIINDEMENLVTNLLLTLQSKLRSYQNTTFDDHREYEERLKEILNFDRNTDEFTELVMDIAKDITK